MIKFDPSKISFEIVMLKSVTTAVGGSISVVDQQKSTDSKEVMVRIPMPMPVARSFIERHKRVTKYLKPVPTAIVRYDGKPIALERHALSALGQIESEGLFGIRRWIPASEENFQKLIKPLVERGDRDWFFDGRYIYSFDSNDLELVVNNSAPISADGQFRKVEVRSLDTQEMHNPDKIGAVDRTAIAFVASNGMFAISPPVWKDLDLVGNDKLRKSGTRYNSTTAIDDIDGSLGININFALKAGREIGRLFGYEMVEPLQLPQMMVELHTVNLPNISTEIKSTYDTGMKFSQTMAWLLGLSTRANTLDSYLVIRSLMKYLTTKGIFSRDVFDPSRVFMPNMSVADIEMLDVKSANLDVNQMSVDMLIGTLAVKTTRGNESDRNAIGSLYVDD